MAAGRPGRRRQGALSETSLPGRTRLFEVGAVVCALALLVGFAPLGTAEFLVALPWIIVVSVLYAVWRLCRESGAAERLGFVAPYHIDQDDTYGCLFVGGLFFLSLVPIIILRLTVTMPRVYAPWHYLLWCGVQDFLFFSLVQRNLEAHVHPAFAIAATALLFGLSHYPLTPFMLTTVVVGAIWGYLYHRTRYLLYVVVSHWMLGIIALG